MIDIINTLCEKWEALIIAMGFGVEIILSLATLTILILEYYYDKGYNESRYKKKKITKHKVKVVIDSDGNARIAESPNDIDINIVHEGKV